MSGLMMRIYRSECIRCYRRVYGDRIRVRALFFNGLRVLYTVYTVFCNTPPLRERNIFLKAFKRVRARRGVLPPYTPYTPYTACLKAL